MTSKDKQILNKVIKEIDVLTEIIKGMSFDEFTKREEIKRATAMTLINIGELIKIASKELKDSAPHIPWNEIMATRNIAAHGYHALKLGLIWTTVKEDVPQLKLDIQNLIK